MPLYEYFCKDCGKRFDKMVRLSENSAQAECPYCGSQTASKQFTTFAAVGAGSKNASSASTTSSSCSSGGRFR